MNPIRHQKLKFLQNTANGAPNFSIQFIIVTHVLEDILELIETINSHMGEIALIFSIPYSQDNEVLAKLTSKYRVVSPELTELQSPSFLLNTVKKVCNPKKPTIIIEIGGYFAETLAEIKRFFGDCLLGIVEDTEAGHRRYENVKDAIHCPIISVARSTLKKSEDILIGNSCLLATENLFRKSGFVVRNRLSLVIGYGRVGRGVAHALKQHLSIVMVYDSDPIARVLAFTEGFQVPSRIAAISDAELIFGATGRQSIGHDDLSIINNGAMLLSCSSKQIEFDINSIKSHYKAYAIHKHICRYENNDKHFYVVGDGQPINFIDEKVMVGPIISLIQSEILVAVKELAQHHLPNKLLEIDNETRMDLATQWLSHFCDEQSGRYLHG